MAWPIPLEFMSKLCTNRKHSSGKFVNLNQFMQVLSESMYKLSTIKSFISAKFAAKNSLRVFT